MTSDSELMAQVAPYVPYLIIGGVFVFFIVLRITRKELRKRVDEIGFRLMRERGLLIWFWLNAPGVMLHELSHALVVLLFKPFGFRITSITLFRVRQTQPRGGNVRSIRNGGRMSLQLGEVQYVRPQRRLSTYIGDGLSGVAPLFGGIAMFMFLYWVATGFSLWDLPIDPAGRLQILRAGWPWWTLIFAPYLILTVTSELWPSPQDWQGARWLVIAFLLLVVFGFATLWYFQQLGNLLAIATFVASRVDFALAILLALDMIFLMIAELLVQALRR